MTIFKFQEEFVAQFTTRGIITVEEDTPANEIGTIMDDMGISCLVVTKHKQIIGYITEKDLIRKIIKKDKIPHEITAADIMNERFVTIKSTQTVKKALQKMMKHGTDHLIVTADDTYIGIFTYKNILQQELAKN